MSQASRGERFRFLYRQGEGAINRREWRLASWPPIAIALAMTFVWLVIAPRQVRDLSREELIDLGVIATYAYLIVYAFALLLCAVAEYFVSAKRFADLGRPPALAGLAPFSLFVAAAANWYQPRSGRDHAALADLGLRCRRARRVDLDRRRTRLRRGRRAIGPFEK